MKENRRRIATPAAYAISRGSISSSRLSSGALLDLVLPEVVLAASSPPGYMYGKCLGAKQQSGIQQRL